ncbi:YciI family protein [Chitinophaga sp. MM2321]|uniref:YciI family protein n=1 Tax=Chitinophaga sp. MM2321 TaxID=3137178 RepID=UPI0032D59CD3
MASKVVPALLLLGFLVVVIISFHPTTPLKTIALSVQPARQTLGGEPAVKRYWMVFLKKGPQRNQSEAEAEEIQRGHINNITRLAKARKIVLAGPFGNDEDLRGIFIMDCKDSIEAVTLINSDPAVQSGRLSFIIKPWWTEKNCLFQ